MKAHGSVKIIAGSARNMNIELPGSARPTLSRVREGMFSSIHFELLEGGAHCLDLFAGSGALGIEALSRGAEFCLFVDSNRSACSIVRNNLKITGFEEQSEVMLTDAKTFIKSIQSGYENSFDFIFFDPPYEDKDLYSLIEQMPKFLKDNGRLIIESTKPITDEFKGLNVLKKYRYGTVHVTKLEKNAQ